MAKLPFALQLDSVRAPLQADPAGALQRVKGAGYDHVEVSGYCGLGAAGFAAALVEAGLNPISKVIAPGDCARDLDVVIADCQALGVAHAALSSLHPAPASAEDWITAAASMAEFGEAFRHAGIVLSYQCHLDEFEVIDGASALHHILETARPESLSLQIAVGWAQYASADPVAALKACAGRVPTLHIQDIKARMEGEPPVPTELGNGATRLGPVLKAAGEAGVQWLIVEQSASARDPLESARMNAAYMRVHVY